MNFLFVSLHCSHTVFFRTLWKPLFNFSEHSVFRHCSSFDGMCIHFRFIRVFTHILYTVTFGLSAKSNNTSQIHKTQGQKKYYQNPFNFIYLKFIFGYLLYVAMYVHLPFPLSRALSIYFYEIKHSLILYFIVIYYIHNISPAHFISYTFFVWLFILTCEINTNKKEHKQSK